MGFYSLHIKYILNRDFGIRYLLVINILRFFLPYVYAHPLILIWIFHIRSFRDDTEPFMLRDKLIGFYWFEFIEHIHLHYLFLY